MTNRRLYLHIGTHKTGSTSIQQSLVTLDNQDWRLIRLGKSGNESYNLRKAFSINDSPIKNSQGTSVERLKLRDQYYSQLQSCESRCMMLSGEVMEGFTGEEFLRMQSFLSALNLDIYFIGYLRNYNESVPSRLQQRLKGSPNIALANRSWVETLGACMPKYPQMLRNLYTSAEKEMVRLFAFDPKTFPAKDVVVDLCLRLGIGLDFNKVKRSNESLSMIGTKILWGMAHYGCAHHHDSIFWKNLVKRVKEDFNGTGSFMVDTTCLQERLNIIKEEIILVEEQIEKHRDFSLIAHPHPKDSAELIQNENQLMSLTPREKELLCNELVNNNVDCSINTEDKDLVLDYTNRVVGAKGYSS